MNFGEGPRLKKASSAQNLTGPRLNGSFSKSFSAAKLTSANTGLQLRSPFAKLNNNLSEHSEVDRVTVKRECQDIASVACDSDNIFENGLGYASVGDSRLTRAYGSVHPVNFDASGDLSPAQIFELGDGSLRSSAVSTGTTERRSRKEHDELPAGGDMLLRNKIDFSSAPVARDESRFPSAASQSRSSPMLIGLNSPISNSMRAVARSIPSLDDQRRNHLLARIPIEEASDDLSALMFKGATDLRSAKLALEQKTEENEKLKDALRTLTAEKNGLLQRVTLIKQKTKDALEANAKSICEMGAAMEDLKIHSRDCFNFVDAMRKSYTELDVLKGTAKEASKRIDAIIGDDNSYAVTQEWRDLLSEVQQEITIKQQVIDLLRDKLEFHQGEYAVTRNRVAELEKMQNCDNQALRTTSDKLMEAEGKMIELANTLSHQNVVYTDVLVKNAELEASIRTLETEKNDLRQSLCERDARILEISPLHDECLRLRTLTEDRDTRLHDAQTLKERLATQIDANEELKKTITATDVNLNDMKNSMVSMQCSLVQAETRLSEQIKQIHTLEKDLDETRRQVGSELEHRIKLSGEKDSLAAQMSNIDTRLKAEQKELEECRARVRISDAKYEMLQDKFEEQTLILRMEKKAHGDVQERFLASEAAHIRVVEEYKKDYEVQIARLQEQKSALNNRFEELGNELDAKHHEFSMRTSQLQEEHAAALREWARKLDISSRENNTAQKEVEEAKSEAQILHIKIQTLQAEVSGLHKELLEARIPSEAHIQEVASLKDQIMNYQKEKEELQSRGKTLILRYETGDLTPEEKLLIAMIHRASQSAHEQQLVAKGNEIRQRDNLLKVLEKRKCDLESQLAQLLNDQAREMMDVNISSNRSLIDPDSWMSSQTSSSPLRNKVQAPDRDDPTTLFDVGISETLKTVDPRVILPALQPEPDYAPSIDCSPPRIPKLDVKKQFNSPGAASFAKLTQSADDSDEIHDFHVAQQDYAPPVSKRKRDNQEFGKPRPLTRSKTFNRNPSVVAPTSEEATLAKPNATANKVKSRKRR